MNNTVRFLAILIVVCLAIAAVLSRTYDWGIDLFAPGLVAAMILLVIVLIADFRKRKQFLDFSTRKSNPEKVSSSKEKEEKPSDEPMVLKSDYRERKSGLNWGGGNVHAANASRGSRRKFMKR